MRNRRRGEWDAWNWALGTMLLVVYGAIIWAWLLPDATVAAWFTQ